MATQSFKDLIVWQRASETSIKIYQELVGIRDNSFRDQIQRSALSVPNNIAEGYARRSDKALKNFLYIAKGSAAETESMLIIAARLKYIEEAKAAQLIMEVQEVSRLLSGFIRKLSAKDF